VLDGDYLNSRPSSGSPRETVLFSSRSPVSKLASVTVDDVPIDPSGLR
jgi:hypothetical protein